MIRSGLGTPIQGPCKNMQEALVIYHYGGNVLYLALILYAQGGKNITVLVLLFLCFSGDNSNTGTMLLGNEHVLYPQVWRGNLTVYERQNKGEV